MAWGNVHDILRLRNNVHNLLRRKETKMLGGTTMAGLWVVFTCSLGYLRFSQFSIVYMPYCCNQKKKHTLNKNIINVITLSK